MPSRAFEIKKYFVTLGDKMPFSVDQTTTVKAMGIVSCHDVDVFFTLRALFLSKGSRFPLPAITADAKVASLFLPQELMPVWIDMLRNEKPLFGFIDTDDKRVFISSTFEPVGDEETRPFPTS